MKRNSIAAKKSRSLTGALRVVCVHGVGHGEADVELQPSWTKAITDGIQRWNPHREVECVFLAYDELFAAAPLDAATVAEAIAKLSVSGIFYGIGDFLGLTRALGGIPETLRWTAGMVAQWAENDRLRRDCRQRVLKLVNEIQPGLIVAHSLGSLICYDAFARPENRKWIENCAVLTLGSQIGNPFVRDALGGRIVMLNSRRWYHLFNRRDRAFAAPIRLREAAFQQVVTEFDTPGFLNHDAIQYLAHPNTAGAVWRSEAGTSAVRSLVKAETTVRHALRKPARRALLVGINDYPNPAQRLEGCVNDVFLMSSVLQECGFDPENIRVVLNERATAAGILERLEWLLEGTEDGQERVFYYSGHGAQIPAYGRQETVDHLDECFVPYDFDWSRSTAVTDDQFHELYSQLPYGTRFCAVFDCCHSGGMTRDGGPRVRGMAPPDDIRHRMLRWNSREQMWEPRDISEANPDADRWARKVEFVGRSGATRRMGRAVALRSLSDKRYDATRSDFSHAGPYLPVILEACREDQLAYEYRHGVASYGAFTYSISQIFRDYCRRGRRITWAELIKETERKLKRLRYEQTPVLVGAERVVHTAIPWRVR